MHFFKAIFVGATAFAAFALAQSDLKFTSAPSAVQGGKTYTLKWEGGDNTPATIILRKGTSNDLKTISTLTTSASGGSYTWHVDNALVTDNDYALQITEGTSTNYWAVSVAASGSASASSSSASSTSASSSTSSSSHTSGSSSSSRTSSAVSSTITSTRNSTTVSSATLTSTKIRSSSESSSEASSTTESSSSSSASASAPSSGSGADGLKSNAVLVLGAVAAIAYLA